MAGLMLRSGLNSFFPIGTTVQPRRESQVTRFLRGRSGESSAGFEPAG